MPPPLPIFQQMPMYGSSSPYAQHFLQWPMNYPDSSYNSASSDLYNSMGSLNNNGSYQVLPMPFFSGQNLEGIKESIEGALAAEVDSPLNEDDERVELPEEL